MLPEFLRPYWGTLGFLLLLGWFWRINGLEPLMMLLSAAAVHEAGHLLVLRLVGGAADGFRLSPFGAVIRTEELQLSYFRELLAVLAGPGANLATGVLCSIVANGNAAAEAIAGAHWVLGIFNLLPAAPLDGWRALQLLLCWLAGPGAGTRIAGAVGGACALVLAAGILTLMTASGGNLWLLPAAVGVAVSGLRAAMGETV